MTSPRIPGFDRFIHSLPVRMLLVIATTLLVTGICPLIFWVNQIIPAAWLRGLAVILVGLAGGLSASAILAGYPAFIRFLTGWIATTIGLLVLHRLTNAYAGIPLILDSQGAPSWSAVIQFLAGSAVAGLALMAWKPFPQAKKAPRVRTKPSKVKLSRTRASSRAKLVSPKKKPIRSFSQPRPLVKTQSLKKPLKQLRKTLITWQSNASATIVSSQKRINSWLTKERTLGVPLRSKRSGIRLNQKQQTLTRSLKSSNAIHLAGKTENRCPYCLEVVKPNDPRGVKICPECHTYHHADCWAVTGTCQVPHYHE